MDSQTLADFEPDVGNNPYELWNRIGQLFSCCGTPCGHPEGERRYASAGDSNGNGSDCADSCEALAGTRTGKALHPDYYGYRPGQSALQVLGQTWRRCGRANWVLGSGAQHQEHGQARTLTISEFIRK